MDSGIFSTSLKALHLQIQHIMEGVGGDKATKFLDALADLGVKEREVLLDLVLELVQKFRAGDERFLSEQDVHQQQLIDSLYDEVLTELYDSNEVSPVTPAKRKVVHISRATENSPVDLSAYRAARRKKKPPCLV